MANTNDDSPPIPKNHRPNHSCHAKGRVFFTVYAAMHECAGLLDDIHYALRVAVSELFVGAVIPIVVTDDSGIF